MANIIENLQKILTSRYGKDVRQAIHDSISDINDIAEGQEELINEHIQDAEAWAKGTKEGTAVPSTDPAYHNNSKYYSEQANTDRLTSEAFAKGTHDGTAVESGTEGYHDNAKYYKEQAETAEDNAEHWYQETLAISQTLANAIIARGTVAFADLPDVTSSAVKNGFMWNISDNFTTTSDFVEGAGVNIPMGANVYKVTINNTPMWDILAGSSAAVFVGYENQIAQADAQGLISENTMVISLDGEAPYGLTSSMILHGNDSVENVLDDLSDDVEDIQTALSGKADKNYVERNALGSSTAIPDQEGLQNAYTFPWDGYVKITANSGAIYYKLAGSNGVELETKVDTGGYNLIYVRKGMKMFKSGGTGSMSAIYRPLTD